MKNFLEHTYQIVRKSLERYLYQVQQKENVKQDEQKLQEINRRKHQDDLTGGSKLRSILRDSKNKSKKLPIIAGLYKFLLIFLNREIGLCRFDFLYLSDRNSRSIIMSD
jgi:hypothetical protein